MAATVLCAWSHPGRIHSEAAFAMLAGVAPLPANSGQVTTRYRLNRYGDRQLNNALVGESFTALRNDRGLRRGVGSGVQSLLEMRLTRSRLHVSQEVI